MPWWTFILHLNLAIWSLLNQQKQVKISQCTKQVSYACTLSAVCWKLTFQLDCGCALSLSEKTKGFNNRSQKEPPGFLHTFLLENETQTNEKNTVLWFSIKSETTCKNSAHLDDKKNGPKFDIEWLCSDVFSWLLICTNSLSPHLRLHYPSPPTNKKVLVTCTSVFSQM